VKKDTISNTALLEAGLNLMRENGQTLTKVPSQGRTMLYKRPDGQTVRVRTCNDHILIVVANSPEPEARLNIEGTDWILYVMPEQERTPGNVIAFLLPTDLVVREVRRKHQEWLESNPNTKGSNTTWNLWFREDGPAKANGYAKKWKQYLLSGATTLDESGLGNAEVGSVKAEVERAQNRIGQAAGVSPAAVTITISFAE